MIQLRRVAVLVATLTALLAAGQHPCAGDEPSAGLAAQLTPLLKPLPIDPDGKNEWTRLLTERHNAAVAHLDERLQQYKRGLRDLSAVHDGARLVLHARLALPDTPEATVRTLEESLAVAQFIETYAEELVEKKAGTQAEVETARYTRLGIEIDLLKAEQKAPMK